MAVKYIRFLSAEEAAELPAGQAVMVAVAVDGDNAPVDLTGGSAEIADGSVTEAKIADGAVTAGKIASGVIPSAYVLPEATSGALGGVRKASAVDTVSAADAAQAAAETVTKQEFDALVVLANANKAAVNGVIGAMTAAAQMG